MMTDSYDIRAQLREAWSRSGLALKRVKVLSSYAAHFRFLADVSDDPIGWIPYCPDVPSPYEFAARRSVWRWERERGVVTPVVIYETRQRRYEVFAVSGPINPMETLEQW